MDSLFPTFLRPATPNASGGADSVIDRSDGMGKSDGGHYLTAILGALPIAVALADPAGEISYINPFGQRLLAVTDPQAAAADIWANLQVYYCGSDRPYPKEELPNRQVHQRLEPCSVAVDLLLSDRRLTLAIQGCPIVDPSGNLQCIVLTFQDITGRQPQKIQPQGLACSCQQQPDSRQCDSGIFQDQGDFLLSLHPDTTILFANEAFCRFFNCSAAEVIGRPLGEFVCCEDAVCFQAQVMQLTPAAPLFTCESCLPHPQKGSRWIQWLNSGVFTADGSLSGIQSVGRDVTTLKNQLLREQALNRVIQAIRNSLDLETIFDTAVREIVEIGLGWDACVVRYLPQRQVWQPVAEYHSDPNTPQFLGFEIPDQDNPLATRLKAGEVVAIADTCQLTDAVNRALAEQLPGAWLLVPLIVKERPWGSLSLFVPHQTHAWSEVEINFMRTIATQLEVAVYQANLYAQARKELAKRSRLAAALRKSEERFRLTALHLPGALFRYEQYPDGRNRVFYLNPMCERLWGIPAAVAAEDGESLWQLVHPEDREATWQSVLYSAANLTPWFWQWRIIHPTSGEVRWLEGAGQPTLAANGVVVWYTVILDVTERHLAEERLKEQQAQLEVAIRASKIGFYFHDLSTGTMLVSPTHRAQLGDLPRTEAFSCADWQEQLHPEDRDRALAAYEQFLRGEADYDIDFRLRHHDGTYRWFHSNAVLIRDAQGRPSKVVGTHIDITDRKAAELALRESEERYRLLAENMTDIVCLLDREGRCLYVSPSYETLLGWSSGRLIGQHFTQLCHPDERSRVKQELQQMIQQQRFWPITHRACTANRELLWLETLFKPRYDSQGQLQQLQTSSRDVTSRVQVQLQLEHEAYHDPLTGLPNRLYFMEQLAATIAAAQRNPELHYAVLFLDVDRFKVINDSLGHAVGDRLLIAFATLLRRLIENRHIVARLGGDEFVILATALPNLESAIALCEQITRCLQEPLVVEERQIFLSSSIGVVFAQNEYKTAFAVLRDADIALYQAKAHSTRRYAIFNAQMYEQVLERLHLEHDLRHALSHGELQLFYQPFFNLADQQLVGMESLVRWQHPERGLILPGAFISIAEDTGLIVDLDKWVLEQACRQFWLWQQQFQGAANLILSVNVSAKTLKHPSFLHHLSRIQQQYPLGRGQLVLELTESIALELGSEMLSLLESLRERHIEISIDDFGTGYSCLSYLHSLPIHHLKVDRAFVQQLEDNQRNLKITKMILVLAQELGYRVIAEGIETRDQLHILQRLGCDYGQGYLFARPMPAEALASLLKAH